MPTPTELDKPASAQPAVPSAAEPVIHVIPEKFYGAALKKKVASMPPSTPPGVTALPKPPKKRSAAPMIIALLLLVAAAAGGYFFVFGNRAQQPPAAVCGDTKCDATESADSCPADCASLPVCGDTKCDATETYAGCPADCPAPAPAPTPVPAVVCGDGKCDATESTDSCPADCTPAAPTSSADSDSDGLTDVEETQIYGTNPYNPDTDRDGFVDLNETLNLYDPAKPSPAMLKDNPGIATYSNAALGYAIYRPAAWIAGESDKQTLFTASSGEFVEVLVQPKERSQSLMDWYLAQAPGVTVSQVEPFTTKQGYDAVLSPDRMTAYVNGGDKVFVVSYNLGSQTELRFRATFRMMIQSLVMAK